jgi:hypothetical protein
MRFSRDHVVPSSYQTAQTEARNATVIGSYRDLASSLQLGLRAIV